jgi:hypothetical protein
MSIISSASGSVLITSGALGSNYSGSVAYGPKQVFDGLILYVDAANPLSYPGSGNTWFNLMKSSSFGFIDGEMSGSSAVIPSWDSTHQGRIHVKASSSYPNVLGPASSSYVNFGALSKPSPFNGINPQFSFNIWFEVDYSKQIVEYSIINSNWYSNFGGNVITIFSKFGDNNLFLSNFSGRTGTFNLQNRRELIFQLRTVTSSFDIISNTPRPDPITNPYYIGFTVQEDPRLVTSAPAAKSITTLNTSSLYYIPDKNPVNIHINYNGGATPSSRIEFYFNGYKTQTGDSTTVFGTPTGDHLGSIANLALGAQIGNGNIGLEGVPENSGESSMMQADAYYYLFQLYNRILSAQEIEQNYFAHRYRFRPWEIL